MTVEVFTGSAIETLTRLATERGAFVQTVVTSPPYYGLRDYRIEGQIGMEETPEEYVANLVAVFRAVREVLRDDGTVWLNLGDSYNAYNGNRGASTSFQAATESACPSLPSGHGLTAKGLKIKDLIGIPWRVAFALQADGWYLRAAIPWIKRNVMPESVTDRPTVAHEYVFLLAQSADYYYDPEAVRVGASQHPQRRLTKRGSARDVAMRPDRVNPYALRDETGQDAKGGQRHRRTTDWFFDTLREIIDQDGQGLLTGEDGDPLAFVVNPMPCTWAFCRCGALYEGKERTKIVKTKVTNPDGREVVIETCPACGCSDRWVRHFAAYPERLVTPCILAATSEKGECPTCGKPWVREVHHVPMEFRPSATQEEFRASGVGSTATKLAGTLLKPAEHHTTGWRPSCSCRDVAGEPLPPIPQVVLDPFGGSGTTGIAAAHLGRSATLIELNPEYAAVARARCDRAQEETAADTNSAQPVAPTSPSQPARVTPRIADLQIVDLPLFSLFPPVGP